MAKFEKGNKKGKQTLFTSDNQPSNRGRKPKLYTIAKKKYNISHEEYKDVIAYLMQCTKKEINSIAEDDNTPICECMAGTLQGFRTWRGKDVERYYRAHIWKDSKHDRDNRKGRERLNPQNRH